VESLRSLPATSLSWQKVKGDEPLRVLPWNADPVAELRWSTGIAAEGATARTADGAWAFDRAGLLTKKVRIEPEAGISAEYDAAGWEGGGELATQLGTRFTFRPANIMSTRWSFVDEGGQPYVTFLLEMRRFFRTVQVVQIEAAGAGSGELPLLVTLGTWLAVLARRDQASGVGTG
jgi:hypothetical protein